MHERPEAWTSRPRSTAHHAHECDLARDRCGLVAIRRRACPFGDSAHAEARSHPLLLCRPARGEPVVVPPAIGLNRLATWILDQVLAPEPVDPLHVEREAPRVPPRDLVTGLGVVVAEQMQAWPDVVPPGRVAVRTLEHAVLTEYRT